MVLALSLKTGLPAETKSVEKQKLWKTLNLLLSKNLTIIFNLYKEEDQEHRKGIYWYKPITFFEILRQFYSFFYTKNA